MEIDPKTGWTRAAVFDYENRSFVTEFNRFVEEHGYPHDDDGLAQGWMQTDPSGQSTFMEYADRNGMSFVTSVQVHTPKEPPTVTFSAPSGVPYEEIPQRTPQPAGERPRAFGDAANPLSGAEGLQRARAAYERTKDSLSPDEKGRKARAAYERTKPPQKPPQRLSEIYDCRPGERLSERYARQRREPGFGFDR